MKYYFFAATLPGISLDTPPPLSWSDFRQQSHDQLTPSDHAAVEMIAQDGLPTNRIADGLPPFYKRWHAIETQLRNAIARRRGAASGVDTTPYRHAHDGFRVEIEEAVDAAFAQASPREREHALDRLRWRLLEELGGTDPFTSDAVLAYACRLRLSERWAGLTRSAGEQKFNATVESIAVSARRER